MNEEELIQKLLDFEMDDYLLGVNRLNIGNKAHIYRGSFNEVGEGMCKKAPSLFARNDVGTGLCKMCIRFTLKEINNN